MGTEHIRNFSIIAHIDHGKSTLADRMLELTGAVALAQIGKLDNIVGRMKKNKKITLNFFIIIRFANREIQPLYSLIILMF